MAFHQLREYWRMAPERSQLPCGTTSVEHPSCCMMASNAPENPKMTCTSQPRDRSALASIKPLMVDPPWLELYWTITHFFFEKNIWRQKQWETSVFTSIVHYYYKGLFSSVGQCLAIKRTILDILPMKLSKMVNMCFRGSCFFEQWKLTCECGLSQCLEQTGLGLTELSKQRIDCGWNKANGLIHIRDGNYWLSFLWKRHTWICSSHGCILLFFRVKMRSWKKKEKHMQLLWIDFVWKRAHHPSTQ